MYTGVTVLIKEGGNIRSLIFAECTDVTFYPVSENEIRAYVNSGEPMDKAGSYAIQGIGSKLVERFEGDYENIVGLPTDEVLKRIN